MLKILFVDDDPLIHRIAQSILKDYPCQTFHAHSGEEGFHVILETRIDIIFMDIFMPGENGIQCARRILNKYPHIKIIGMTASNDPNCQIEALGQGMKFFFYKPLDKTKIKASIQLYHPEFSH